MTAVLLVVGLVAVPWIALLLASRRQKLPPVLLPATLHACGCLCSGRVVIVPCAEHDPAEPPVEQWAAELGQEES